MNRVSEMPRWQAILVFALNCVLAGCNPSQPALTGPKGTYAQHCASCHAQAGEPGGPKLGSSKGTNLTHIGSEPGRTVEWLAAYIRDPKSQRSNAKMPAFEGKLTEEEIRAVAELLAAQK
jgi:mono/diheme cytochrome c family protein